MRTTGCGGRRVSGLASATAALAPFAQQVKHVDGQEPALPAISDRKPDGPVRPDHLGAAADLRRRARLRPAIVPLISAPR